MCAGWTVAVYYVDSSAACSLSIGVAMYLCYVDDSGSGSEGLTTLTGILVHEDDWVGYVEALVECREEIQRRFGVDKYIELHAVKLFKRPGKRPHTQGPCYLDQLSVEEKLQVGRMVLSVVSSFPRCRVLSVCSRDPEAQGSARLYPRFVEALNNWASVEDVHIMVHYDGQQADAGDWESSLRNSRPFRAAHRRHPSRWGGVRMVVEDPVMLDSKSNFTVQAADIAAFCTFCMIREGLNIPDAAPEESDRARLRSGAAGLAHLLDGLFIPPASGESVVFV